MDIDALFPENEIPLDRIPEDGGFASIFRTIGCVGDSLSSGEFESRNAEGKPGYHDMFEYSWGQYMARTLGCTVHNFSRGGMTAKEYLNSFADANRFWDPAKACQAYIIALGVNDLFGFKYPVGSMDDIKADRHENGDSFMGDYARIVARLKEIQPRAKFFFVTIPRGDNPDRVELGDAQAEAVRQMAEHFGAYVIDLRKYGPVYDKAFQEKFYLYGHMNPCGYVLTAKMMCAYIDYHIRHNMDDFRKVPYIGTDMN